MVTVQHNLYLRWETGGGLIHHLDEFLPNKFGEPGTKLAQ